MKKLFIFGLMLVFSMSIFAQKEVIDNHKTAITVKKQDKIPNRKVVLHYSADAKTVPIGTPIGMTNYDLQSNSCVATRIINHGDGTISAVWLQDQSTAPGGATRGSGYNYYDGSSWQYTAMTGNERIENTRTGWPTLMSNGTVEFVANHYNSSGDLFGWSQNIGAAGSGWTQNNLSGGPEPMLWPRAASAGDNFYVIAVDDYVADPQTIDGLHFYKSTNAGTSWTYKGLLPNFTDYYANGNGDQYAIDAVDSTVAIVYFGGFSDTRLWKSVDYGETWTQMVINDFPVDQYSVYGDVVVDVDADGVADTCMTTDNIGDVIIDNNGMVHVVFGRMRVLQIDASAGSSSYFPYTDYLLYWNEGMGEGVWDDANIDDSAFDMAVPDAVDTIGYAFDLNGDNIIWQFADAGSDFPFGTYFSSITAFPSLGIDADGNIYCAFTTVMEGDNYAKTDATPNAQSFRGAWISSIDNNGGGWSNPLCFSDVDGTNAENVFPTLARNVDDFAYLWLQWDNEPGLHIRGDEDAVTDNYIIYKAISVDDVPTTSTYETYDVDFNFVCDGTPVTDVSAYFAHGLLKSGSSSTVSYSSIPAGTFDYTFSAAGQTDQTGSLEITGNGLYTIDFCNTDPVYDVSFSVKDSTGNPLDNVEVTLGESLLHTAADGTCIFHGLVDSTYDYTVHLNGSIPDTVSAQVVVNGADASVEVLLSTPVFVPMVEALDIKVYPNPVNDYVTISNIKNCDVLVYDMLGNLITFVHSDSDNANLDMTNFAEGTYIIKVVSETGVGTAKVVKSK